MTINTVADFDRALACGPYSWPGGYPVFFVMEDGEALSFASALAEAALIRDSVARNTGDGWRVIGVEINWEDDSLRCAHTGEPIEAAYTEAQS